MNAAAQEGVGGVRVRERGEGQGARGGCAPAATAPCQEVRAAVRRRGARTHTHTWHDPNACHLAAQTFARTELGISHPSFAAAHASLPRGAAPCNKLPRCARCHGGMRNPAAPRGGRRCCCCNHHVVTLNIFQINNPLDIRMYTSVYMYIYLHVWRDRFTRLMTLYVRATPTPPPPCSTLTECD